MTGKIEHEALKGLPEEKVDMLAATSVLQQQASEIRQQRVNWQSYLQGQMITQEDFNFITAYDRADQEARAKLINEHRSLLAKTFLNLLEHVSRDLTIQYVLVMIDDMLQEDRSRVEIFREHSARKKEPVCGQFLNLLNGSDGFIVNMTATIIAKIACWSPELMDRADLNFYLTWLKDQLKVNNNEYMQSVARCLQMMLRVDEYRAAFISVDGISTLMSVLSGRVNFQIQYQLIFCLWVLTFNPKLAERMNKFSVIPILADILSDSVKEKVTRIILAAFRNLIEKPEDSSISKEHCIAMVQSKVLKQLSILEQRKFDDEDIVEDVQFLNEKLQASVQDLSSFDEYATEVKTGRLEWSPVHRSAQFWRENAARLNEKNYELLRILIHLLETSRDALVLSVASYDIGEYVRHYPRGKLVIESLGGKQLVMQLLSHEDPNVRYEALLAVQKLMVHNWEYLGKQLEKEHSSTTGKTPSVLTGKA
ncbi:vacuolar ATP synthase subunit H [Nesidiocoris tenuis]|uniref:V-type proton ATPase subunit H n=1 Tax=Nesidiocoris tenuis TaxID=355587 RepID=A0ABN7A5Q9_9HEMI|nr:vacuolar ATP synthase subunit H [Nesidiocoris tenuis]